MPPACLALSIIPGATLRQGLLLLQPDYCYREITAIQPVAPLQLTVPGHDLPADWPGWIEGCIPALNRQKGREPPHWLQVIDSDTLAINALNGTGYSATGGQLVYQPPVDLAGCTARMTLGDACGDRLTLTSAGGGIELDDQGQVSLLISAVQSAGLTRPGTWSLDITHGNGDVMRWAEGPFRIAAGGPCHG